MKSIKIGIERNTRNFYFVGQRNGYVSYSDAYISDTDLSLCGVPKRMATDLHGLRAMPLSQNQACRDVRHDWSALMS